MFNSIEPIGELRDDVQAASICSVLSAVFGSRTIPIKDFVLDYWGEVKKTAQTAAGIEAMFRQSVRRKS